MPQTVNGEKSVLSWRPDMDLYFLSNINTSWFLWRQPREPSAALQISVSLCHLNSACACMWNVQQHLCGLDISTETTCLNFKLNVDLVEERRYTRVMSRWHRHTQATVAQRIFSSWLDTCTLHHTTSVEKTALLIRPDVTVLKTLDCFTKHTPNNQHMTKH